MNIHVHVDKNAASQRMRSLFKRTYHEEGLLNTIMLFIVIPLTFVRDYTIPIGEFAAWNRQRAAFIPVTQVAAFFYLNGNL